MGLFSKKKLSLEEILEGINSLTDEEKAKALEAIQGTGEENENVQEEVKGEAVENENAEEVEETLEEDVQGETVEQEMQTEEPAQQEEESADATLPESESASDELANDNRDEIIHQLVDKVNGLSEQIKGLLDLKELMEEYTSKQAYNFGVKGNVLGAKKDYKDMSADELKAHVMKGI